MIRCAPNHCRCRCRCRIARLTAILVMLLWCWAAVPAFCKAGTGTCVAIRATVISGCESTGGCIQTRSYGSAVVLAPAKGPKEWNASTAAHTFKGVASASQVEVYVDNQWKPIKKWHWLKSSLDVAFISFECDEKMELAVPVEHDELEPGEDETRPGDEVRYTGFANGSTYVEARAVVKTEGLAIGTPCQKGQSGGGVYNLRTGRMIGIVVGHGKQNSKELYYEPMCVVRRHCVKQWGFWICPSRVKRVAVVMETAPPPPLVEPPPKTPPVEAPPTPITTTRGPTDEQIGFAVKAWMTQNAKSLQGPAGERGPQGPGPSDTQIGEAVKAWMTQNSKNLQGPAGPAGVVSPSAVENAVASWLNNKDNQKKLAVHVTIKWADGTPVGDFPQVPAGAQVGVVLTERP